MSSRLAPSCGYGKAVAASIAFIGLVLFAGTPQADTLAPANGEALSGKTDSDPEVSFWVDSAPLTLVIKQLASLSGRTAQIEESPESEEVAKIEEVAVGEEVADSRNFAEVLVSGRFSGSLGSTLAKLSADYPVTFDLDGETLRAMNRRARSNVSIAMISTTIDETLKNELLASSGAGNLVEFREDAVRVTGHPAFVKRQAGYITRAMATAEARLNADSLTAKSGTTSVADSGSTEVMIDIQDEGKPPAEQANLSKPIRWVTDIPGYHTF